MLHTECKRLLLGANAATKALVEAIDTATGVHNFLLAGKERVALRTYVNVEVFAQCRASLNFVAAAARGSYVTVIRMNLRFHGTCPCS